MHTVDRDSEQGKRVEEVINEVLDLVEEFAERDYPPVDLVSALMGSLAITLAPLAGTDDTQILDYADQVRTVVLDVHTEYVLNQLVGDPAND